MKAITIGYLINKVGKDDARNLYNDIAEAGGFGINDKDPLESLNDLDVGGLPDASQKKIAKLLGESVEDEAVEKAEAKTKKEGGK